MYNNLNLIFFFRSHLIKMPSLPTFFNLCMKEYQNILLEFLSTYQVSSESQEFFEHQIKLRNSLPTIILDHLINDLLLYLSERRESQLMLRTIEFWLSAKTRTLCLCPFDYARVDVEGGGAGGNSLIEQTITIIQMRKPKLTHLELNYDYFKDSLQVCLKEFPTLKSLTIQSMYPDNSMMEIILKSCPALEELNLIFQHLNFVQLQINTWPKHETLSVFTIKSLSNFYLIEPNMTDEIFQKLPNLEIFQTNNNFLNLILSKKIPLILKSLLISNSSILTGLENLFKLCPETDSVSLETLPDEQIMLEFIPTLQKQKLIELSIFFCNQAQLMYILENCGSTLKSLVIHVINEVNLSRVLKLCPNLECLDIHFSFHIQVDEEIVPHLKLGHLRLYQVPDNIINIFKSCNSLEIVEIASWVSYTPSQINDVTTSFFKNIKTLRIYKKCQFTFDCLKHVIRRCNKLEQLVIPLENDHYNLKQVELFVKNNNYNLNIVNSEAYKCIYNCGWMIDI